MICGSSAIVGKFSSVNRLIPAVLSLFFLNFNRTDLLQLYQLYFKFCYSCIFKNYSLLIFRILFSCPFPFCLPTFHQSFESVLRHPKDNRTQISELGQTLIDGGILDELISEKLAAFNSRSEQLNQQVRTSSSLCMWSDAFCFPANLFLCVLALVCTLSWMSLFMPTHL